MATTHPADEAHEVVTITSTWADNMTAILGEQGITRKQLVQRFAEFGHPVSEQAIGGWLRGEYSPRPIHQAIFARLVRTPHHLIFPITLVGDAA